MPLAVRAQSVGKIARVGYLTGAARNTMPVSTASFIDRLRELGYVEDRNLVIDYRFADTEVRLRGLASALIHAGAQVIYAQNPYALRAAIAATTTIPIVGYDYETDPGENKNLAEEKPDVVKELAAILAKQPEAKPQVHAGGAKQQKNGQQKKSDKQARAEAQGAES